MKKILLILIAFLITSLQSFAQDSENIALLTQKGFFKTAKSSYYSNPYEEIRKTFLNQIRASNSHNLSELKSFYADNYVNADGLNKEIYFDLVKKTWESYPDIKYRIEIKNIVINDNLAVVQVHEVANSTTDAKSGVVDDKGCLSSYSDSVYYLEKINNEWLVTSDYIIFEQTSLFYGSAKYLNVSLSAPVQIQSNTSYTTALKILPPKDSFIIASIGRENITYPQVAAEEVFRKLPEGGILERVFVSNSKNMNEYAVASFGVTKAEIKDGREIKISVTGLGFVMSRVNVTPQREVVKVSKNGENK